MREVIEINLNREEVCNAIMHSTLDSRWDSMLDEREKFGETEKYWEK